MIFDLYQLNTAERDLVYELCTIGLDLFYRSGSSEALAEVARPERSVGTLRDVAEANAGLAAYLRVFLESWERELGADGELFWRVLAPPSRAPLLAVSFGIYDKKALLPNGGDQEEWRNVLARDRTGIAGSGWRVSHLCRHVLSIRGGSGGFVRQAQRTTLLVTHCRPRGRRIDSGLPYESGRIALSRSR